MNPNTIRAMAPLTKKRFHFAASSFSRMYGVSHVSSDMIDFCYEWAHTEEQAPFDCLNHVDRYFRQLWDTSHAGHQRRQLHQDFFVTFWWLFLLWASILYTNTTGNTGNHLTRGTRSSIITSVGRQDHSTQRGVVQWQNSAFGKRRCKFDSCRPDRQFHDWHP